MPNNIIMADASGYKAGDWLDVTKPEGEAIYYGTNPEKYGFYKRNRVTGLIMPNAVWIPDYIACGCTSMTKLIADEAIYAGQSACDGAGLLTLALPKLRYAYTNAFSSCQMLESVDFGGSPSASEGLFRARIFFFCGNLKTMVLRANVVWTLASTDTFGSTPFASGKSGGTLYVPQAMIAEYQAANNWSTILGYPNNNISAIEGSQYEHYYVDGRPIPTGG